MFDPLRQHGLGVAVSIGLHAVLVLALMVGIRFAPKAQPRAVAPVIEAVAVNSEAVEREMQRLEQLEQEELRRRQETERRQREEAERVRREAEQEAERERQRLQQLAREREEAERLAREREEAQRREAQRLAELERQRAEEERRRRAEEERRRQEEEARLAEQRRQEEERRRREEEERRLQAELDAQLQREIEAEAERLRAVQSGELEAYIRMIQARIEQNWIEPPGTPPDLNCEVNIVQIPSGDIVDVRIGSCNGNEAVIRSIEAAVQRSSPLPLPRISSLFERNLNLHFCPNC